MAKKNGNGEGSIVQRKNKKWQASIWTTLPSGDHKRRYFYGKTRKECAEWLTQMRTANLQGKILFSSDTTVSDWLDEWLNNYSINIRPATRSNYITYINKHIKPHRIGKIPLGKLTTHDLQSFVVFLKNNGRLKGSGGLSPKTIRNIMQMLKKALKQAVGNGYLWCNPADFVELPKAIQTETRSLNMQEQKKLLEMSKGEPWRIGIILLLFNGIRIGELLALRQDSVCYEDGIAYLNIRHSLQRVTDFDAKGNQSKTKLRISDPKTENSKRQIPLLPEVAQALETHMSSQKHTANRSYGMYTDNPYIICNELGEYVDPTTFRSFFNSIVKKAGIQGKVTPHTLRHTFASHSLKQGMDLKHISALLGHYSTDFTARTYIHADLEGKYTAMKKLSGLSKELLLN